MTQHVTEQAFRDHEMRLMNPPYRELVDEQCSGGDHVLSEHVYMIDSDVWRMHQTEFFCSGCTREKLVHYYQDAFPSVLADAPFDVEIVERCDGCGMYRCTCGEDE